MWLITICLTIHPYICQDQIRYGLWDTKEQCIQRMGYVDVRRRVMRLQGKGESKCIEIPARML